MKNQHTLLSKFLPATLFLLCSSLLFVQCTEEELKEKGGSSSNTDACTSICCSKVNYCGISEAELNEGIVNYRDQDWIKTSNYFSSGHTISQYLEEFCQPAGVNERQTPLTAGDFDARYMDMDIEQLENYLCMLKRSGVRDQVQKIRFYYIRYGKNAPLSDYKNKHSLALIPVTMSGTEIPSTILPKTKENLPLIFDPSHCQNSAIANHNNICPPEPPIGCSDRLRSLDRPQH
ncbi:MAG: hypothetical protein IT257_09710 [Chitinophagaceae bacterium]|nr:hypothetical protein [Chitinophagaceae bacterium]